MRRAATNISRTFNVLWNIKYLVGIMGRRLNSNLINVQGRKVTVICNHHKIVERKVWSLWIGLRKRKRKIVRFNAACSDYYRLINQIWKEIVENCIYRLDYVRVNNYVIISEDYLSNKVIFKSITNFIELSFHFKVLYTLSIANLYKIGNGSAFAHWFKLFFVLYLIS